MNLEQFQLTGRVALVTGAAQGLGAALALGLAEAGASVALLDRQPLDASVDAVRALGVQAIALRHDLAGLTPERAAEIISECVRLFGRLDILVNNAGIIRRAPALDFTPEDWEAVLDINLSSVFFLSQAAARHFVAEG